MWSILFLARNLAKVSDEKGGPLSVDKLKGIHIVKEVVQFC